MIINNLVNLARAMHESYLKGNDRLNVSKCHDTDMTRINIHVRRVGTTSFNYHRSVTILQQYVFFSTYLGGDRVGVSKWSDTDTTPINPNTDTTCVTRIYLVFFYGLAGSGS